MTSRRVLPVLLTASIAVAACGSGDTVPAAAAVDVPERSAPTADPALAGASVTAFGARLLAAAGSAKAADANVVVSPLSVAIALGMVEPGTTGEATPQLHELLGIDDLVAWHASMNALEQSLEARAPDPVDPAFGDDQEPGELLVRVANAAFLQPGYPFRQEYLAVVGSNYGATIEELDFTDAEAAADRINGFIAANTDDHITDLVQPEAIDPATVLALVNALLLQASWQTEFDESRTVADGTFTLADGSTVTLPMMHGHSDTSMRGDGWVGARKQLIGGLAFEVVLPDAGRFDEIAARYGDVAAELAAAFGLGGELVVPRFETRVNTELTDVLPQMGLTAPFGPGTLLGIAGDPLLQIDTVLHEAWISVDESGIEAAAATVVLMIATSAPAAEPVAVVLDRPFLFRIVDQASGATLFTGRIMNPTA